MAWPDWKLDPAASPIAELLIAFQQQGESIETARPENRASASSRMVDYLGQLESEFMKSLRGRRRPTGMSCAYIALQSPGWLLAASENCRLRIEHARKLLRIRSEQLPVSPSNAGTVTG